DNVSDVQAGSIPNVIVNEITSLNSANPCSSSGKRVIDEDGFTLNPILLSPTQLLKKLTGIPSIKIKTNKEWPRILNYLTKNLSLPSVCQMAGPELLLIKTQKVDDYFKAREYLKNENIEFYTYQVPSLRKLDFVVRDLPASTPVDVIKEALLMKKSRNPGPFKKRPCPLFKIALDHSVNKEKLTSLTHLIGLKIRITE
ncbi:hypothetical protein J437_LFUL004913, partial [Ladona fulva]